MKIIKILNNNVIIATDSDGREVIVMKKGLGFSRKAGDHFPKDPDQKIFVLSDEVREQYHKLMKDIRPLAMELAEKIISHAFREKKISVTDMVHLTLADHLDGLIDRLEKGIDMPNQLTVEIGRVYSDEFEVGLYGKRLVEEETGCPLLADEAAFIALHFIAGEKENSGNQADVHLTVRFISDITKIVGKYFGRMVDENSFSYLRFVRHLRFLVKRIYSGSAYADDAILYDNVAKSYPKAADCVERIGKAVQLKYKIQLSTEEKAYLIIYVEKLMRE